MRLFPHKLQKKVSNLALSLDFFLQNQGAGVLPKQSLGVLVSSWEAVKRFLRARLFKVGTIVGDELGSGFVVPLHCVSHQQLPSLYMQLCRAPPPLPPPSVPPLSKKGGGLLGTTVFWLWSENIMRKVLPPPPSSVG